jgi:hypothetical protein
MGVVQVTHHGSILVNSTAPQGLIEGRVDAGKGHWTRSGKATAIVIPLRAKLRKVNSYTSTITKGVGNKPPRGFDALGTLHRVLYNEDSTTDRKTRFWIIDP